MAFVACLLFVPKIAPASTSSLVLDYSVTKPSIVSRYALNPSFDNWCSGALLNHWGMRKTSEHCSLSPYVESCHGPQLESSDSRIRFANRIPGRGVDRQISIKSVACLSAWIGPIGVLTRSLIIYAKDDDKPSSALSA